MNARALPTTLALLVIAPCAGAAGWTIRSDAQLFSEVESNPRMQAGGGQDARSAAVEASMQLQRRTELLDVGVDASAGLRRYDADVDLDRDEQHVDVTMQRRGERWVLAGSASLARDTTLTSELGSTGQVQDNLRHRSLSARVAPSWLLSERTTAGISYAWQQSQYERAAQSRLTDYRYRAIGANTAHQFSERGSLLLSARAGRMDGPAVPFETDSLDVTLLVNWQWSPRWQGSLAAGPSWVQSSGRRVSGSVFSAALLRRAERFSLATSVERNISPTGSGVLSRRDQASLQLNAMLGEHVDGGVHVSYARSREYIPRFGFTLSEVRYASAGLSLYWRFAQDWSLGAALGSAVQGQRHADYTGRNHEARLVIAWRRLAPIG